MEVGVIGAGRIGVVLTGMLGAAGHDVLLANSRDPASLRLTLTHMAPSVRGVDVATAAQAKDVVVLAIPFYRYHQLPFKALAGRVVLDATNYSAARDGAFPYLDDGSTTSSETIAGFLEELAWSRGSTRSTGAAWSRRPSRQGPGAGRSRSPATIRPRPRRWPRCSTRSASTASSPVRSRPAGACSPARPCTDRA